MNDNRKVMIANIIQSSAIEWAGKPGWSEHCAESVINNLLTEINSYKRNIDPMENRGDLFSEGFNCALDKIKKYLND